MEDYLLECGLNRKKGALGDNMNFTFTISLPKESLRKIAYYFEKYLVLILSVVLSLISVYCFILFYRNGLGLAYNDARSHLDIGRRVVEGLKPGLAQLGSVWLPLPHLLMAPTIWNDFMWHSGLAGALQSMISFVVTGILIYLFLRKLGIGLFGRLMGVFVFVANLNILYMQSTAMTELLLIVSMTAGVYYLLAWQQDNKLMDLLKAAFWVMLATLNRYDGWFLLIFAVVLIFILTIKRGYKTMEGTILLFLTLSGVGIMLWFLWNLLIFKDPLYFIFGPYSAHAQQQQLQQAGVLATYKNIWLSSKVYYYSLVYNLGMFTMILGAIGAVLFYFDKKIKPNIRIISIALLAPLVFNILALYFGFSVLFVQGLSGNTWFNVRYGIMMAPSVAIFVGYLFSRVKNIRIVLLCVVLFITYFSFASLDAVTIDDARVGSSGKNVTEVSGWLHRNAKDKPGFVLISAASHDAIIFSSGLPMSKFIHEGTGAYWISATTSPDRWARWIIMRTNDLSDQTFRLTHKNPTALAKYYLVGKYPFADIYEIKPQYLGNLHYQAVLGHQK